MEESKIKVYAQIDENRIIKAIDSEIFLSDFVNWVLIDEGYGDKYAHAQGNYLDKPITEMQGKYNYKYVDNKVVEFTEEEKEKLFPTITLKPSPQELINARLLKFNADTQLQLKNQITVNAELLKQIAELKGGNQ